MTVHHHAASLAFDVTTTEFALAVRDAAGHEDYAALPMRGAVAWQHDAAYPGFELDQVPGMIGELLQALSSRGWNFRTGEQPQYVSVSCRQHDQVVLGHDGTPLMPALSWQCHAAEQDVCELRALGVEQTVGTIEARFVLPKLRCVLRKSPSLRESAGTVFMTGDWIACALTGERTLSTSDALSNGLLGQSDRRLASQAIEAAGLDIRWFPRPVQSGTEIGVVLAPTSDSADAWNPVRQVLQGWRFVAGLGDNHASAVGCGMNADYRTMVVSGGTSGTINLSCPAAAALPAEGKSLRFEFYENSLLLLQMLGDCGAWYKRFLNHFATGYAHDLDYLNILALSSDLARVRRVLHSDAKHTECFPPGWSEATLGEKTAWTQFSIVLELLLRVKGMLEEVRAAGVPETETFVLTGGLSQSPLFQHVFRAGIERLAPGKAVRVSGRQGPLRYKTSAYGALINAELPRFNGELARLHTSADRFPLVDCAAADRVGQSQLRYLLESYGV